MGTAVLPVFLAYRCQCFREELPNLGQSETLVMFCNAPLHLAPNKLSYKLAVVRWCTKHFVSMGSRCSVDEVHNAGCVHLSRKFQQFGSYHVLRPWNTFLCEPKLNISVSCRLGGCFFNSYAVVWSIVRVNIAVGRNVWQKLVGEPLLEVLAIILLFEVLLLFSDLPSISEW